MAVRFRILQTIVSTLTEVNHFSLKIWLFLIKRLLFNWHKLCQWFGFLKKFRDFFEFEIMKYLCGISGKWKERQIKLNYWNLNLLIHIRSQTQSVRKSSHLSIKSFYFVKINKTINGNERQWLFKVFKYKISQKRQFSIVKSCEISVWFLKKPIYTEHSY